MTRDFALTVLPFLAGYAVSWLKYGRAMRAHVRRRQWQRYWRRIDRIIARKAAAEWTLSLRNDREAYGFVISPLRLTCIRSEN